MNPCFDRKVLTGIVALLFSFFTGLTLQAQTNKPARLSIPFPRSFAIGAGGDMPAGLLHASHGAGADLRFYYARQRLGRNAWRFARNTRPFATAGYQYYPGKKVTVSNYPYTYPAFQLLSAGGGLVDNHLAHTQFFLSVSPALGLYQGTTRYYTTASLQGAWYPFTRSGILGGAQWMQESGARPFWSFHLQYVYCLW